MHVHVNYNVIANYKQLYTCLTGLTCCFFCGKCRNRAIQGDTVAIQPLPREEWRGSSRALPSSNTADSSHDKSCDNVVPTGRVVAVIDRTNRDIVASFPVRERKLIYMYCKYKLI